MILLLGGTAETGDIARRLIESGLSVLVSTATGMNTGIAQTERLIIRSGPLDDGSFAALLTEYSISAVVDATHPYADEISRRAARAALEARIPCLRYSRLETLLPEGTPLVPDHQSAARQAFRYGTPVLLTTGSRNIKPYADESRSQGIPLFVRILPLESSRDACTSSGIPSDRIIAGQGPFTVKENVDVIRRYGIGVIVTKNSGDAGGVPEKIEAAMQEGCRIVVVARPEEEGKGHRLFSNVDDLITAVNALCFRIEPTGK